jgi:hypothetical protein
MRRHAEAPIRSFRRRFAGLSNGDHGAETLKKNLAEFNSID